MGLLVVAVFTKWTLKDVAEVEVTTPLVRRLML